MMAIGSRIQAYRARHPVTMSKKIDQYLVEHLPDLMDEYKIADRNDITDLDPEFEGFENKMSDLEIWKEEFDQRLDEGSKRIERLTDKYGLKGGGKK
ncbi:MAG: hypothetical protein ACMUFK_04345 [Thermoplasmatota archaeon]